MIFIIEKSKETTFNFSKTRHNHINNGKAKDSLNGSNNDYAKFATKRW